MKKIIIFTSILLSGCATHTTKLKTFNLDIDKYSPPVEQTGCGWMLVDEKSKVKFAGITINKSERQFDKTLYYCCPGANEADPICYQTQWVVK